MKKDMPAAPEWLAAPVAGRPVGVDREKKVIRGYVVAELGPFKTPGRGQFDDESLNKIVSLFGEHPSGLKSRFTHPGLSSDGLGSFLGRAKGGYRDGTKVRADLHLADSSFHTPNGDLGGYVLDLASEDPEALSSSLVLKTDKVYILDDQGRQKTDEKGDPIPPIWRPVKLHASDVVDTGDAVNGFLAVGIDQGELPDGAVRLAFAAIDKAFPGVTREVLAARLADFAFRYLDLRYGPIPPADAAAVAACLNGLSAGEVAAIMGRDRGRLQKLREREAGIS
jgi:hypothetical protein